MEKKCWKVYGAFLAVTLAIGALAGWLIRDYVIVYDALAKPPLAAPRWAFPVAWTILYILMAVSAAGVWCSGAPGREKRRVLSLYGVQLAVNFAWTLLFFLAEAYGLAFFWLLLLLLLVALLAAHMGRILPWAGRAQIPYLLWMLYAAYLNLGVWVLN